MVLIPVMLAVVLGLVSQQTKPFVPHPALTPLRRLVVGLSVVAAGLLLVSVPQVWWTVDDVERGTTIVTRGTSWFPLVVVALGLVSVGLTVAGVLGRRNWAPVPFWLVWGLVAWGWFESTGEPTDSDAGGVSGPGLDAATCALLVGAVALALATLNRLLNRRQLDRQTTGAVGRG
jgi:hypothetical protein